MAMAHPPSLLIATKPLSALLATEFSADEEELGEVENNDMLTAVLVY